MSARLPGCAGYPVVGDKSLEFYKDAVGFVQKRIEEYGSKIFVARFLNKPTVFICSNAGVQEMFNEKSECIELGYKAFMHQIFGDNILFTDGEEAGQLREVLSKLFTQDKVKNYQLTVDRLVKKYVDGVESRKPICIYSLFKRLSTEICLTLFLDIDFEQTSELAQKISDLTTAHWHGIISMPVNLQLPLMNKKSSYGKALEAKMELLNIIQAKLAEDAGEGFPKKMENSNFSDAHLAVNHLLLFTSALVPKALSSLLTSFVLATSLYGHRDDLRKRAERDSEVLDQVLLEVQRMYPPFQGGRRLVRKDCSIQGYKIPRGHAMMYMTRFAQRDPDMFTHPDDFNPSRWAGRSQNENNHLFLFGSGPRCCVGQHLIWSILRTTCQAFLDNFDWEIVEGQNLQYKWLPVSRPEDDLMVTLTRK